VSLSLYKEKADSFCIQKRERLHFLETGQRLLLSAEERVSLFSIERRQILLSAEERVPPFIR